MTLTKPRKWTDQEILDALKYWAERYGRSPRSEDWLRFDPEGLRPTAQTVWQRCGGWTDALIMAGLEPNGPAADNAVAMSQRRKFDRLEARQLRKQGLSDGAIARKLGVNPSTISKVLGPKPKPPRKPQNAEERRQQRIEALHRALEKEKREAFEQRLKQIKKGEA